MVSEDTRIPQPGEIVLDIIRYRKGEEDKDFFRRVFNMQRCSSNTTQEV